MKKKAACLAMILVFGIAGTTFAKVNPFSDVPVNHWSYESVSMLAKAGIVDGYVDGSFRGHRTLTRYEMAQIVANAMTKSDRADAQMKAAIDKLAIEFAAELNKIDPPVEHSEKKAGSIVFDGETMIEYAKVGSKEHYGASAFEWRQRVNVNGDFNDHISFFARIQAGDQMSGDAKSKPMQFSRLGFTVKNLIGKDSVLTIGRLPIAIGRGLAFADTDNNDGIMLKNKFGKALVTSYYLSESGSVDASKNPIEVDVTGINVDYTANKQFIFNIHAFKAEKAAPLKEKTSFKEVALSYELKKGVNLLGDYIKSNAPGNPNAYAVQLAYNWKSGMRKKMFYGWEKHVNPLIAHDQGISIAYIHVDAQSIPNYGNGLFKGGYGNVGADNIKGIVYGYENMLEKNLHFYATYSDLKQIAGTKKDNKTVIGIELFY